MLGERTTPEATVTYAVDGGDAYTSFDDIPDDTDVTRVDLSYYCPYCDGPNHEQYPLPFEYTLATECEHCGYRLEPLFMYAESGPLPTVDGFDDIPPLIEQLRDLRLNGERAEGMTYRRFSYRHITAPLIGLLAVGLIIAPASVYFFGLQQPSTLQIYAFFIAAGAAGIFGALGHEFGSCWGLNTDHRWWNTFLYKNTDLYKRGLRRQTDTTLSPPMYQPDTGAEE